MSSETLSNVIIFFVPDFKLNENVEAVFNFISFKTLNSQNTIIFL